jgi:hypothetical protein
MLAQPEFRKSERFVHKSIIKIENDFSLSPYYAVSHNLSEAGICFKSIFEFFPGTQIVIRIEDYTSQETPVPAKVVWCKKLKDQSNFDYEAGAEFLKPIDHVGSSDRFVNSH